MKKLIKQHNEVKIALYAEIRKLFETTEAITAKETNEVHSEFDIMGWGSGQWEEIEKVYKQSDGNILIETDYSILHYNIENVPVDDLFTIWQFCISNK